MGGENRLKHPNCFLKNSGTNHFQSPQKKSKKKKNLQDVDHFFFFFFKFIIFKKHVTFKHIIIHNGV